MRKLSNNTYLIFFVTALFALSVMSCNEESAQQIAKREKAEQKRIDSLAYRVGTVPIPACDDIHKADTSHIFDTLKVDVRVHHYKSLSECRIALRAGIVKSAYVDSTLATVLDKTDGVEIMLGRPKDIPLYLVASKKSRVTKLQQLQDKIIAADSHGDTKMYANQVVDSLKAKKKTVFVVQCEDMNVRTQMLTSGNVDAAILPEPFASQAIKKGCVKLKEYKSKVYLATVKKILDDKRITEQYQNIIKGIEEK